MEAIVTLSAASLRAALFSLPSLAPFAPFADPGTVNPFSGKTFLSEWEITLSDPAYAYLPSLLSGLISKAASGDAVAIATVTPLAACSLDIMVRGNPALQAPKVSRSKDEIPAFEDAWKDELFGVLMAESLPKMLCSALRDICNEKIKASGVPAGILALVEAYEAAPSAETFLPIAQATLYQSGSHTVMRGSKAVTSNLPGITADGKILRGSEKGEIKIHGIAIGVRVDALRPEPKKAAPEKAAPEKATAAEKAAEPDAE